MCNEMGGWDGNRLESKCCRRGTQMALIKFND